MNPLVSIIVNNYNYGRFVGEAIESALAQSYRNTEVIVVDDGSTDNSREVIAGYGSRIIPVLKANGGQGSAFNAGFAASRGEFVLFLDADDVQEPNAIETALGEWKDGATRIFFPLRAVDANGRLLGRIIGGTAESSALLGPFGCGSPTSGNVFSRATLEKIMPIPEEDWRICADFYLCGASSVFGDGMRLEHLLGRYRVHEENNFHSLQLLARVRRDISLNFKLHHALFWLTDRKIGTLENWLGASPEYWIRRIRSLRESPQDHPWPDTLRFLTGSLIRAAWRYPSWNFRRKLGYTAFSIAYSFLPWKIATALKDMRDGTRGRVLGCVLGSKTNPESDPIIKKPERAWLTSQRSR